MCCRGSAVHALFEGYVNQSKYMPFILTRCLGPIGPGQLEIVRSNTDGKGIAGKHLDQQFN